MKYRPPFRKLFRFARMFGTLSCTAICVAMIFLWVRSYFHNDSGMLSILPSQRVSFHGGEGRVCVWFEHSARTRWTVGTRWIDWNSNPIHERTSPSDENRIPIFHLKAFWPKMTRLYIAHWLIVLVTATVALAPWIPRKISLHGFMMAMTAVAMVIATITWIDRTF